MAIRQRFALLVLAAAAGGLVIGDGAAAQDKTVEVPAVKPITGITLPAAAERGSVAKPTVIADAKDLAKVFPDEKTQARIKEQVDLGKQELLLFRWSGSGQDKLTPREQKDGQAVTVVFEYTPGLTRDLRPHAHLFAVHKGLKWKVEYKARGK